MNFIKISSFKKAQIILRINAFLLFIFIIITPHLIKEGIWGLSESTVEGIFLAIEIIILIRLFKNYDFHSNKSEEKVSKLSGELEEQKELSVDTLKYLGRVNVQMSIIKQLVERFKSPMRKQELDFVMNEMLQTIVGLINNREVALKIIDLKNYTTLKEIILDNNLGIKNAIKRINNNDFKQGIFKSEKNGLCIIPSEHNNFLLKTFVVIDKSHSKSSDKLNDEQLELVQNIINQCEIIYLLFHSDYYKNNLK